MKNLLSALWINSCLFAPAVSQDSGGGVDAEQITAHDYRPGIIKHIVLFRYKAEITGQERQLVKDKFLNLRETALRNGRPYISSIVTGQQNGFEGLDKGYDQGFIVTFASEGDRNYYVGTPLVHDVHYLDPAHDAFKQFVRPYLHAGEDGVLVFDFREE